MLELTQGRHITLTYNLYFASGVGELAGNSPALDVSSLPLYAKIKDENQGDARGPGVHD